MVSWCTRFKVVEIGMTKALAKLGLLVLPVQNGSEVWRQLRPTS